MVGGDATEKFADLARDQVSVVTFRIRAKQPGVHRFTVFAYGTKFSDAIRRQIEVVPDGKEIRAIRGQQSTDCNFKLSQTGDRKCESW